MKKILFAIFLVLPLTLSAGDYRAATEDESAKALELFDVSAETPGRLACDFVQTRHTSLLENDLVAKGKMEMFASDSLVWTYMTPEKKRYSVDLKSDNRFAAMSRKADFARSVEVGDNDYKIVLAPLKRDLKKLFTLIEVHMMKNGGFSSVTMSQPGGDYVKIDFSNVKR